MAGAYGCAAGRSGMTFKAAGLAMLSLQSRPALHSFAGAGFCSRQRSDNAGHHSLNSIRRNRCQNVGHHQDEIIQRLSTVYHAGFELVANFAEDAAVRTGLGFSAHDRVPVVLKQYYLLNGID
jgi:hypothetical protein